MEKAAIGVFAIWGAVVVALLAGWVMNIVKLIGFAANGFTGNEMEAILRAVGVFAAPLGAVLGYF